MFVWCISAIWLLKKRTSKIYTADFSLSGKHFSCKTAARPFVSSSRVGLIWSLCWFFATSSQRNKHSPNMATNKSHQAAVLPFILFTFDQFSLEETVSPFPHPKLCEHQMRIFICVKPNELMVAFAGLWANSREFQNHTSSSFFSPSGISNHSDGKRDGSYSHVERTIHSVAVQWRWFVQHQQFKRLVWHGSEVHLRLQSKTLFKKYQKRRDFKIPLPVFSLWIN